MRTVRCRRRASNVWFDDDCLSAKRYVRLFERDIRRVRRQDSLDTAAIAAATAAWSERRHEYCALLRQKRGNILVDEGDLETPIAHSDAI